MKWHHLFLLVLFVPMLASGQHHDAADASTVLSPNSPFEQLATKFLKTTTIRHAICPKFLYYQNNSNPTYTYFNENLPFSSEWAIKIPIPASTQATVCTVWTQMIDF